ncbi:hypothetical protein G7068_15940 [Leucobacter viscericola]|uniref:Uncharacterized protein n=1 Tax=Leucobacter viscericola TaxID=2714935 RepID=A0A6G7XJI4_9MICO|nr:hypothetical protein [Leucobacter viscericola]QIK64537.1 hypothetical protein G7068_15940 [Leucobacter viscericola]
MSTRTVDEKNRTITETFETEREGIVLAIVTTHLPGRILTRARRREVTPLGFREKFTSVASNHAPVPRKSAQCNRYSLKRLEAEHAAYMAEHVSTPEQIEALTTWAERF